MKLDPNDSLLELDADDKPLIGRRVCAHLEQIVSLRQSGSGGEDGVIVRALSLLQDLQSLVRVEGVVLTGESYTLLRDGLRASMDQSQPQWDRLFLQTFLELLGAAAYDVLESRKAISLELVSELVHWTQRDCEHLNLVCLILHRVLDIYKPYRPSLMKLSNQYLQKLAVPGARPGVEVGKRELLLLVESQIRGFNVPLKPMNAALLTNLLLPLHSPTGGYDPMAPLLTAYHEPLISCMCELLEKKKDLVNIAVDGLLNMWPSTSSAKEVLFLTELEAIIEQVEVVETLAPVVVHLARTLSACMASPNSRLAEIGLTWFRGEKFLEIANVHKEAMWPYLVSGVCRDFKRHWNMTVNTMTLNVIEKMREMDSELLSRLAAEYAASMDPCVSCDNNTSNSLHTFVSSLEAQREEQKSRQKKKREGRDPKIFSPKLSSTDFVFGKNLGDGSFSVVHQARLRNVEEEQSHWDEYAVKVLTDGPVAEKETKVMEKLDHPFVVKMHRKFSSQNKHYLVMDFVQGGDLFSVLHRLGSLDVEAGKFISAEVVLALEYLHSKSIVFNDLKPENILLTKDNHIKLTDFGAARDLAAEDGGKGTVTQIEGTAEYVSPEEIQGAPATPLSDLWSLGCFIFQIFAGKPPFWAEDSSTLFKSIVSFTPEYPKSVPPAAADLCSALLKTNPAERLGSPETGGYNSLKSHPFFQGIRFDSLSEQSAPKLAGGSVGPAPNEKWSQRRYSMVFTPLPAKYTAEALARYPIIWEVALMECVWPGQSQPPALSLDSLAGPPDAMTSVPEQSAMRLPPSGLMAGATAPVLDGSKKAVGAGALGLGIGRGMRPPVGPMSGKGRGGHGALPQRLKPQSFADKLMMGPG